MKVAGEHYGAHIETIRGTASDLGGDTRAEGREAFENVIAGYERVHPERAFKSVYRPMLRGRYGRVSGQGDRDGGSAASAKA